MTWKCRLVDYAGDWVDHKVGDMFWGPTKEELLLQDPKWDTVLTVYAKHLSEYYWKHNSDRRPLFVILPGLIPFCIDGQVWVDGEPSGGWTVTGDAPNITVMPSINAGGTYHGFLQNGLLSADVEGRLYGPEGYEVRPLGSS